MSSVRRSSIVPNVTLAVVAMAFVVDAAAAPVTVTWDGGAGNWNDTTMWTPDVVPNNGVDTYDVLIDGGKTGTASVVTLNMNAWIDTLTVDTGDALNSDPGRNLYIEGSTISNAGTLSINPAGVATRTSLYIAGDVTLSGGGTIHGGNANWNYIQDNATASPAHLINEDNTIRGSLHLGDNTLQLTNRGTVLANQTANLVVDPNASGMVNSGLMQADGGTLELDGGTYTNFEGATKGVIDAQNGSAVSLTAAHIIGGRLTTSGTGVIETTTSGTLENLDNEGHCRVNPGHSTRLIGAINNTGTISVNPTGVATATYLYIPDDVTLTGGGTVQIGNYQGNYVQDNTAATPAHLVNEDNTIQGAGRLGHGTLQITNRGTIAATDTAKLVVNPNANGVLNDTGGTVSVDFESDGTGSSGLGVTGLSLQTVDVQGQVNNYASALFSHLAGDGTFSGGGTLYTLDFGTFTEGDPAKQGELGLTNDDAADGYSESLNASFTGTTGDATTAGAIALLAPGATDGASMVVGIDTSAAGNKLGTATITFESDGAGSSGLGVTALPPDSLTVEAVVNAYADPDMVKKGGHGSLTEISPTEYMLSFGTVTQHSSDRQMLLAVLNDVVAPADWLAGVWTLNPGAFVCSGFDPFDDLLAGQQFAGLSVALACDTLGLFTGSVTLHPLSENASGYSGLMDDIVINLRGRIVEGGERPVPEPAGLGLVGLALLALRRRRR